MTVQREAIWNLVVPDSLVGPAASTWPRRWSLAKIIDRGRHRRLELRSAYDVIGWAITGHVTATAAWAPAPVCWSADFRSEPPLGAIRIDPVRLIPGPRGLAVAPARDIQFRPGEGERLGAAVAEALAGRAIRVRVAAADRWYMTLADAPDEPWRSPEEVEGTSLLDCLPDGDDAEELRHLLNEIQIVLHQQPDNETRRDRGEPEVNSVWPWGWAVRPLPRVESLVDRVYGDHPYAAGLGLRAGIEVRDSDRPAEELGGAGAVVLSADRCSDPGWVESAWGRPLLRAQARGRIARVRLVTPSGRLFELDDKCRRRFWRRSRRQG